MPTIRGPRKAWAYSPAGEGMYHIGLPGLMRGNVYFEYVCAEQHDERWYLYAARFGGVYLLGHSVAEGPTLAGAFASLGCVLAGGDK